MPDYINFLLGCCPNWAQRTTTLISAGGEASLRGAAWQKTRLMSQVWRTPSLKPRHTQETLDFGSGGLPSRALFIGNINVPDAELLVRVRKDDDVSDEWVRPLYHTAGGSSAFLASTNVGSGDVSSLDDDPYSPNGSWVTPSDAAQPLDIRLAMRIPLGSVASGSRLQAVQVAYSNHALPAGPGPSIRLELWQSGVWTGLFTQEDAFPSGETGSWVLELKFDVDDLPDPMSSGLQVRVLTTPAAGIAVKVGAVRWLATKVKRTGRPAILPAFLAATNANTTNASLLEDSDALDPAGTSTGVSPTVATSALDFRVGFADPGALDTTAGAQAIAVRFAATAGTTGQVTVTLYVAGVASGLTATATASAGAVPQWLVLPFSSSDLSGATTADVQARITTAPSGSNNVAVKQVQWIASLTEAPYAFDTGWYAPFPGNSDSLWGISHLTEVGKPIQRSFYVLFFDDAGVLQTLQTRYTRVEFALSSGGLSFTDDFGNTATWMDVGRYAEGPAVTGPNLAVGFEPGLNDPSTVDVSDGGVRWEDDEMVAKELSLKLSQLKGLVASSDFYEFFQRLGKTTDVLLVVFPGEDMSRNFWTWGPLSKEGGVPHDFGTVFKGDIQTVERI